MLERTWLTCVVLLLACAATQQNDKHPVYDNCTRGYDDYPGQLCRFQYSGVYSRGRQIHGEFGIGAENYPQISPLDSTVNFVSGKIYGLLTDTGDVWYYNGTFKRLTIPFKVSLIVSNMPKDDLFVLDTNNTLYACNTVNPTKCTVGMRNVRHADLPFVLTTTNEIYILNYYTASYASDIPTRYEEPEFFMNVSLYTNRTAVKVVHNPKFDGHHAILLDDGVPMLWGDNTSMIFYKR
jgi:hypothetical protein